MKKSSTEINEDINLMPVVIFIPNETVQLKIEARLMDEENFKVYKATKVMNLKQIRMAIIDGDKWEAGNEHYLITEDKEYERNDSRN